MFVPDPELFGIRLAWKRAFKCLGGILVSVKSQEWLGGSDPSVNSRNRSSRCSQQRDLSFLCPSNTRDVKLDAAGKADGAAWD